jgi:hypothetical protein
MEQTPLERAARALAKELGATTVAGEPIQSADDLHDAMLGIGRVDLPATICAVLTAIREPNDAIVYAGAGEARGENWAPKEWMDEAWKAMIDAALADSPSKRKR